LELGSPFELSTAGGEEAGIKIEAFAVPGKVALYMEDPDAGPGFGSEPEDTVGLRIEDTKTGAHFFYVPGCSGLTRDLAARLKGAPLVLISRVADPGLRREWRRRIEDHDGTIDGEGGIERWLVLAEGVGLDRGYVMSTEGALPATKFAVEAYVHFVRERPLLEAIASSLTELFAPDIHKERIAGLLKHYDFANESTLSYFQRRLEQAPRDVAFGLDYVLSEASTEERQEGVLAALRFKDGCFVGAVGCALSCLRGAGPHPARCLSS
jgi:pyrroloquinoline-quinone synthase